MTPFDVMPWPWWLLVAVVLFVAGFLFGRIRESRRQERLRKLDRMTSATEACEFWAAGMELQSEPPKPTEFTQEFDAYYGHLPVCEFDWCNAKYAHVHNPFPEAAMLAPRRLGEIHPTS